MAKLHEPRLAAQRKNLPEQSGESSQMPLAKLADRAEIRVAEILEFWTPQVGSLWRVNLAGGVEDTL